MKMAKKIVAIFLAALTCFAFVGCSNDGAPDGMHLVSLEGEPFKLYVPKSWGNNVSSGISSAYFSGLDNVTVSARYYTSEDEDTSLDEYVDACVLSYSQTLELFNLEENNAAVLSGVDAKELIYTAKQDGTEYTFRQLIVKYQGDFVLLTFHAPSETYENYADQFDAIAEVFTLCEKGDTVNDCVTDKKTPDGMKIASTENVEYRLYVPQSWICNTAGGASEAYVSESGKPNVTVTAYYPEESMSIDEYFEMCEDEYEDALEGYELISAEDRTVAERDSRSFTYKASHGGADIRIMQTVIAYNERFYSITYTALDDSFDAHMDDVDAILDAFRFR